MVPLVDKAEESDIGAVEPGGKAGYPVEAFILWGVQDSAGEEKLESRGLVGWRRRYDEQSKLLSGVKPKRPVGRNPKKMLFLNCRLRPNRGATLTRGALDGTGAPLRGRSIHVLATSSFGHLRTATAFQKVADDLLRMSELLDRQSKTGKDYPREHSGGNIMLDRILGDEPSNDPMVTLGRYIGNILGFALYPILTWVALQGLF